MLGLVAVRLEDGQEGGDDGGVELCAGAAPQLLAGGSLGTAA